MISSDNDSKLTTSPACRFDRTILGVLCKSNCNIDSISFRLFRNKMYLPWMTSKNQKFPAAVCRPFPGSKNKMKTQRKREKEAIPKKVVWSMATSRALIGLVTCLSSHKDATRVGMTKVEYEIISPHKFVINIYCIKRSLTTNNTLQLYSYFKYFNRLFDSLSLKVRHEMDFIHSYCRCLQNATNRKQTGKHEEQMLLTWKSENTGPLLQLLVKGTNKLDCYQNQLLVSTKIEKKWRKNCLVARRVDPKQTSTRPNATLTLFTQSTPRGVNEQYWIDPEINHMENQDFS